MNEENKKRFIKIREEAEIKKNGSLMPFWARTGHKFKTVKKTGDLENLIKDFLNLQGFICDRTGVKGTKVSNKFTYIDSVGFQRTIGSDSWRFSSGTKGKADLSIQIYGLAVNMEIKIGGDTQRDEQEVYEQRVIEDGGIYVIIKTFDMFIEWFDSFIPQAEKFRDLKKGMF
jgi:hypothetical protein